MEKSKLKSIVVKCNGKTYTSKQFMHALINGEVPDDAKYTMELQENKEEYCDNCGQHRRDAAIKSSTYCDDGMLLETCSCGGSISSYPDDSVGNEYWKTEEQ